VNAFPTNRRSLGLAAVGHPHAADGLLVLQCREQGIEPEALIFAERVGQGFRHSSHDHIIQQLVPSDFSRLAPM
jgi:hypothetical protein